MRYGYPLRNLIADDIKAGVGLALCGGPLFLSGLSPVLVYIFAGLTALFAVFAAKTAIRHTTAIELSAAGIRDQGPLGHGISWEELEGVELRYYSTRRDRERGWMTLRLKGPRTSIALESTIDGFEEIATQAARVAGYRGVDLSPATRTNFEALGIALPPPRAPA